MRSLLPILLGLATAAAATADRPTILCPLDSSTTIPSDYTGYAFTLKRALNYDFVSRSAAAAAQLCQSGGPLVDNALQTPGGAAVAAAAVAWGIEPVEIGSEEEGGYVASALVVRAPAGFLDELNDQVGNATSRLYNSPDPLVKQVAQQIDDRFDVFLIPLDKLNPLLDPIILERVERVEPVMSTRHDRVIDLGPGPRRPQPLDQLVGRGAGHEHVVAALHDPDGRRHLLGPPQRVPQRQPPLRVRPQQQPPQQAVGQRRQRRLRVGRPRRRHAHSTGGARRRGPLGHQRLLRRVRLRRAHVERGQVGEQARVLRDDGAEAAGAAAAAAAAVSGAASRSRSGVTRASGKWARTAAASPSAACSQTQKSDTSSRMETAGVSGASR
ncbi:hypothetical protein VTG60DRAFT_4261 [Thermothelomyces hinnuleus]